MTIEKLALPEIVHQGIYRLYRKPDGTLRCQYKRDDSDDEDFFELPGDMVTLAARAAKGELTPADMVKAVMAMMRG